MNKLGKHDKEKVYQFIEFTGGASEKDAIQCLKNNGWKVQQAVNGFFNQVPSQPAKQKSRDLEELFRKYSDQNATDMIMAEGIIQLCTDLQVDPADPVMLVLSHHMQAATMGEFSKKEFFTGMQHLKVDSVQKLREKFAYMRGELRDDKIFKEIYQFAFGWAREKGQKSLALETAIGMWKVLFTGAGKRWALVDHWCEFLETQHDKAISKDTWTQLFEFASNVDNELTNYDATTAWASLIDDFADYLVEKGVVNKDLVGSRIKMEE